MTTVTENFPLSIAVALLVIVLAILLIKVIAEAGTGKGCAHRDRENTGARDVTGDLTRLAVNLTGSATTAMEFTAVLTGDTSTDTVNRALLVYSRIAEVATGGSGRIDFDLIDGGNRVRIEVNRPWWRPW